MPNWNRFRSATLKGDSRVETLRRIQAVEGWLARPEDKTLDRLLEEVGAHDISTRMRELRTYFAIVSVVRLKMGRDGGVASGEGAHDRMQRTFLLQDLISKAGGGPIDGSELREKMVAIFPRVERVLTAFNPAVESPEHAEELKQVLAAYEEFASQAAADDPALPELWWMMGSVAREIARRCLPLDARHWLERAVELFERAGDRPQADDCRTRMKDLALGLAGDVDLRLEPALGALAQAKGATEPAAQAAALIQLVSEYTSAGDLFEAKRTADAAAKSLGGLGLKNPLEVGLDAAVDSWIESASNASVSGTDFLQRFGEATTSYFTVLSVYASASPASEEAERLMGALNDIFKRMPVESEAAQGEIQRTIVAYFPVANAPTPKPPDAQPPTDTQLAAMDDALIGLTEKCNRRVDSGKPLDDLVEVADRLRREAKALRSPLYETKALLRRVYVTLRQDRAPEALDAAREAATTLLSGREAKLASFATSFERHLYLEARCNELKALVIMGKLTEALTTCEDVVRDIESQRCHVNSPFQQSAFLSWVADFYQIGVVTALKLERWDTMINFMESVKARAAVMNRLTDTGHGMSLSELEQQFEDSSTKLAAAVEAADFAANDATATTKDLAVHRRWLWDMLAIERRRSGAPLALPDLTLANLQATLDAEEAAVGYLWLNASVVLVVIFDRTRFHAERVILDAPTRKRLDKFIAAIQKMRSSVSLDQLFEPLGAALFPDFCRAFVAEKRRLIISPNHSLHLFPFHAARYQGEFLGTRFAIRYVPNFSSLLVGWQDRCEDRVMAVGVGKSGIPGFTELPEAESEVNSIRACYAARGIPVDVLIGDEATRKTLERMRDERQLSRYRFVHLATHGESVLASAEDPLEARLVLRGSFLDIMDIAALGMGAEVAVLSACHTGQRAIGRGTMAELPGDDIFGMQSALFESGVHTVMGTLWRVESVTASAIVTAFHRRLAAGDLPEVAMQSAVLEYLRDSDPAQRDMVYWAPFFLSSLGTKVPRCKPKENNRCLS